MKKIKGTTELRRQAQVNQLEQRLSALAQTVGYLMTLCDVLIDNAKLDKEVTKNLALNLYKLEITKASEKMQEELKNLKGEL